LPELCLSALSTRAATPTGYRSPSPGSSVDGSRCAKMAMMGWSGSRCPRRGRRSSRRPTSKGATAPGKSTALRMGRTRQLVPAPLRSRQSLLRAPRRQSLLRQSLLRAPRRQSLLRAPRSPSLLRAPRGNPCSEHRAEAFLAQSTAEAILAQSTARQSLLRAPLRRRDRDDATPRRPTRRPPTSRAPRARAASAAVDTPARRDAGRLAGAPA
jgi:hypothetical protein